MSYDTHIMGRYIDKDDHAEALESALAWWWGTLPGWVSESAWKAFIHTQLDKAIASRRMVLRLEDCGNMTSNVGAIYRKAMPDIYPGGGKYDGVGDPDPRNGLPGLSGLTITEAIPIIESGIAYMDEHREALLELEPKNGWGSFDSARTYLAGILSAARRQVEAQPDAILCVNW